MSQGERSRGFRTGIAIGAAIALLGVAMGIAIAWQARCLSVVLTGDKSVLTYAK